MIHFFNLIRQKIHKRPLISFLVLCGLTGMMILAVLNLEIEENITRMLPPDSGTKRLSEVVKSPLAGEMPILIKADGAGPGKLEEFTLLMCEKLKSSDLFSEVTCRTRPEGSRKLGRVLFEKRGFLTDPAELESIDQEEIRDRLNSLKSMLALPGGMIMQKYMLQDPLGLTEALGRKWAAMAQDTSVIKNSRIPVAADGSASVILTRPVSGVMQVRAGQEMLTSIREISESIKRLDPQFDKISVIPLGAHTFAANSAAVLMRDLGIIFPLSIVLVCLLFILQFRRLIPLVSGVFVIGFGILAGLSAVFLSGERIHGLSLGFGAALVGVAIDYVIHYLNAARYKNPEKAAAAVLKPVVLALLTTLAAFAVIASSSMPAMRQIAILSASGLFVCAFMTLALLPVLNTQKGSMSQSPAHPKTTFMDSAAGRLMSPERNRRAPALVMCVLFAAGGIAAGLSVNLDPDIRRLDARFPVLEEAQDLLREKFSMLGGDPFIAEGRTLDEALERMSQAVSDVKSNAEHVQSLWSVAMLIESGRKQVEQKNANRKHLERLMPQILSVAQDTGFKEEAFNEFRNWVHTGIDENTPALPQDFDGTPLEILFKRTVIESDGKWFVLGLVSAEDRHETSRILDRLETFAGIYRLSTRAASEKSINALAAETLRLACTGFVVMLLVVAVATRRATKALLILLPPAGGCAAALMVHAVFQMPVNIVTAMSLVLIMGMGMDYGIFIIKGLDSGNEASVRSGSGVLLSACTTLMSFGILVLARNRAMFEVGLTVAAGILFSVFFALYVIPALKKEAVE